MESYKIENLSFTYLTREEKALDSINLTVQQGEFVTLCGKSGSGKTTLLRLLKTSLAPFGKLDGNVYFEGKPLADTDQKTQAGKIGLVMQNPDNQIVTDKVWHELAFGPESLGMDNQEIRARVSELASFFGIENWFYKNVNELSGGQKQILNLASVMAISPSVLILDEPTSQLDPISAQEFIGALSKINRELGTTVILSEHRLEEALPVSGRVIVMDEGKIIADGEPRKVGEMLKKSGHDMYMALPAPMRVYGEVDSGTDYPVTVRDGRIWLENYAENNQLCPDKIPEKSPEIQGETVIELKDVWFRYQRDLPDVIKGMNLKINKGELFAMVGGNGTGKTTAMSLISGISRPYRGEVFINGENISKQKNLYNGVLGVLPQNPQSVFVKNTVYLDLMEILSDSGLSKGEKEAKVTAMAKLCRIEALMESHPYDLSGGEQQRTALAKVLLASPEILLLDEPTKGFDAYFKRIFAGIIADLKAQGVTVVLVSHDIEFCAEYADRCALVFDGNITSTGTPREFFAGKNFYTTSANRMARTLIPEAILAEDIILACGKKPSKIEIKQAYSDISKRETKPSKPYKEVPQQIKRQKPTKRTLLATLLFLFAVPLTIYVGTRFFGSRRYYFISLLIILETMIPFCMLFESRKPKAREIVVISVLCALAVAGRTAFAMLPQFKPVLALIIISGVCLGGETGFLIGAVTGFVSNFFFGQGPWTPWQMFTLGIIGFLAGILFRNLPKTKINLCIFGIFSALIIYGGIMNPASVIMWQDKITWEMIMSAYATGLAFDIVQALSTAFFLWFISEAMIEKIERIKVKFGLIS